MRVKKLFYNNGIECRKFEEGEAPDGWVRGMLPRTEETNKRALEKRKKSCLEKYGVEHVFQSSNFKEKSRQTSLKKYGTESPMQSDTVKAKRKKTSMERYGSEHPMQSVVVKEKFRNSMIDTYGVPYATQSDLLLEKSRNSCLEKYGVEYSFQSKVVQEKSKETLLERYGVEHPLQSEEILDRLKATNLERYGVEYTLQADSVQEKIRKTNLERYGVDNPWESPLIREKIRETNLDKYGVEWFCQHPDVRLSFSKGDSLPNREFALKLDNAKISYVRGYPLGHYSYDFKVGNTLIEVDPYPTHNSLWGLFGYEDKKDANYHKLKSQFGESTGFRVIHVFDWDDTDKIINSLLLNRERLYARDCEVGEVSIEESNRFLEKYHLQGMCRGQSVRLGLYNGEKLISLMTFGKPRYNKSYEYELLRYCSSHNVVGGADRLFTNFLRNYNPESMVSYCDRSKFRGDVYNKLGFLSKGPVSPSCHWYGTRDGRHLTDNIVRQYSADMLLGTHYGKNKSNSDILIENGFVPIYDCGQEMYYWRK